MIIFGKLCFCVMFLQARRFTNLQTEIEHDSYLWCNISTGDAVHTHMLWLLWYIFNDGVCRHFKRQLMLIAPRS